MYFSTMGTFSLVVQSCALSRDLGGSDRMHTGWILRGVDFVRMICGSKDELDNTLKFQGGEGARREVLGFLAPLDSGP